MHAHPSSPTESTSTSSPEEESTLVMANVSNALNVRSEPNTEAEKVGYKNIPIPLHLLQFYYIYYKSNHNRGFAFCQVLGVFDSTSCVITPALVQEGCTAYVRGGMVSDAEMEKVKELLSETAFCLLPFPLPPNVN